MGKTDLAARKTAAQRGYGSKWRKAREAWLRKYPLCADHLKRGMAVIATIVDHVTPHRGNLALFWDRSNWQSLCKQCHDGHKQRLEKSGIESGCDLDGMPLDIGHHWRGRGG